MKEQLVWLIDVTSDTEITMSIEYKSKIPHDAVYRGKDKDGKNWEVYNTATSPDRDYRPAIKDDSE